MKINKTFTSNIQLLDYCRKVSKRYNSLVKPTTQLYDYDLYSKNFTK